MKNIHKLALTAMFAAIASVLMFFEFPLPLTPSFLKLDLSDVAVLIGGFVLGPFSAVAIALIKDLIHLSVTTSGGVGELADFLISALFCVTASLLYRRRKTIPWAIAGCGIGIAVMMAAAAVLNKFLLLPFYTKFMPLDAIFKMCAQVNPFFPITDVNTYLLYAVLPFNLVKGALVSVVALLVAKNLEVLLARAKFLN